jgi:ubiquinone/menaquinone biosynthesis C-methylase UbiE
MSHWNEEQAEYWSKVASSYDELYRDHWSQLEDSRAVEILRSALAPNATNVLDLGAGTGLGYSLLRSAGYRGSYVAQDISEEMIVKLKKAVPSAKASVGPMDDLSSFESGIFDSVLSMNTSTSFSRSIVGTLEETERVLRPGGSAVVSFLGRRALGLQKSIFGALTARYVTRHAPRALGNTPAWFLTPRSAHDLCVDAGLHPTRSICYSFFRGSLELPYLWRIDGLICKLAPPLSGVIYLVCRKNEHA